jgi:hypothetical protein
MLGMKYSFSKFLNNFLFTGLTRLVGLGALLFVAGLTDLVGLGALLFVAGLTDLVGLGALLFVAGLTDLVAPGPGATRLLLLDENLDSNPNICAIIIRRKKSRSRGSRREWAKKVERSR